VEKMAIETKQSFSRNGDIEYRAWWDKWLKKNMKKQARLISKATK
jgi:hypothetical protein